MASKIQKIKRIFHTWDKWECYPDGFYENSLGDKTKTECEEMYRTFLSDLCSFKDGLEIVLSNWTKSCEHYLSNEKMNRIAWLGQASVCAKLGVPSCFRGGYFLLDESQRRSADLLALEYLNKWLVGNGYEETTLEGAGINSQSNIY